MATMHGRYLCADRDMLPVWEGAASEKERKNYALGRELRGE